MCKELKVFLPETFNSCTYKVYKHFNIISSIIKGNYIGNKNKGDIFMKTTHDCAECPILKLMEKHFPPKRTRDYDITTTEHACGYIEFFEFDDTPGWRSKDYWTNNENCMLNKEIVEHPSEKIKDICHKILRDSCYDGDIDYEIGEGDIDLYLADRARDKYFPHLSKKETKALYEYMRRIVKVVPGYVWEHDPDDIYDD